MSGVSPMIISEVVRPFEYLEYLDVTLKVSHNQSMTRLTVD